MDPTPPETIPAPRPTGALALTSLVLGILAVALSFLIVGFLLGLFGLLFACVHLARKAGPVRMARWGLGLSIFGMIASVGFGAFYFSFFQKITKGIGSSNSNVPATGFQGTSNAVPALPAALTEASQLLHPNVLWSSTIPGAQSMCVGDWDNDGTARILVAAGSTLHVLDLSGAEKSALTLPGPFKVIECGRNKTGGARLLGYGTWGNKVDVIDHTGKELWYFQAMLGADGAHWGDLDGDGTDEMIVGMNGFGGIQALTSDGKKLWTASLANVWNQAIVPATANRPGRVFATEAGGTVRVFDATGHPITTLRPGEYFAQMTAHALDDKTLQIIAISGNSTVAFDETGKVAWKTSAFANPTGWSACCFTAGDLKGDGSVEWVFVDGSGDLVIATPAGEKIGSIANQKGTEAFAVAPRAGQRGVLATLNHGTVTAYELQP